MQKKIIALAIAGLSGAAFAQSNVTIYGVVDQALDMGSHGNGSKARMVGSGYMTERIGFKGEEALGNGLTAIFNLEAGLGSNNGTVGGVTGTTGGGATITNPANIAAVAQVFSREAKVGLKGKFGELAVGRLYTPWFSAWAGSDPFMVAGAGSNYSLQRAQTTRINNAIRYDTPAMGGFGASLAYGTGDVGAAGNASVPPLMASVGGQDATAALNKNVGRHLGLNLRFANGPVSLAYGYAKTDQAYTTAAGGATLAVLGIANPAVIKQNTLSGSYDLGMVKLFANWSSNMNDVDTAKTLDNRTWSIALSAPVGAGVVKFQYGKVDDKLVVDRDSSLTAIGYHYGLSKRTTVYTTYAKVKNTNGGTTSYLGDGPTGSGAGGATGSGVNAAGVANGNFGPSTLQAGISHSF